MKKTYFKPEIMFEDFSLSTNIATGCEVLSNNQSSNQCGLDMSGIMVFVTEATGCAFTVGNTGDEDGMYENGAGDPICYHVPLGQQNLFNS